jgi:hypothetical protein
MGKKGNNEVEVEGNSSASTPSEMEAKKPKFSQSTNEIEVEVIKDFKGLKAGAKVTVSQNVAEILTNKGLVK